MPDCWAAPGVVTLNGIPFGCVGKRRWQIRQQPPSLGFLSFGMFSPPADPFFIQNAT